MTPKQTSSVQGQTEVMSGADSAWLRMEQGVNQMAITGMLKLDPPLDPDAFRLLLKERLLIYPRFTQRVIHRDTIPIWEPAPEVDLNYHVQVIKLDEEDRFESVQDYVSYMMSKPLDFNRPLWEMHIVNSNGHCTLVAKLHHCIADGIALVRILLSMATVSPEGEYFQPHLEYQPKKYKSSSRKPGMLAQAADSAIKIIRALFKFVSMPSDTPSSIKGDLQTRKHAAWSNHMPLEAVKKMAEENGVTINDILLWLTCSTLHLYLKERGELSGANASFRVTMPVNLRSSTDRSSTGNRFGLIFLKLPVGVPDAEERLRLIKKEMNFIKQSGEAYVAFGVLRLLGKMPLVVESLVISFLSRKCSAVVTNVPGPRRTLYLAGSQMKDIMFWVPKSGKLGLGISLISYDNRVRIGIASDASRMDNPKAFADLFEQQFEAAQKKALSLQH